MRFSLRNRPLAILTLLLVSGLLLPSSQADEGQWPLSMLAKLDLKKAGLELDPKEIINPEAASLVDAICRVGGATGSFVSNTGLIVTNHHVAFDAVSQVSTPEMDYLQQGFVAETLADEILAPGYVCQITVGYEDVSAEVLSVVTATMTPEERLRAVHTQRQLITAKAQEERPELRPEVAEMFQGRNYMLFYYQEIQDVRLVCVPPRAVGEYGGEHDNWVWPRHTGDFAFLRAYVGPDGKPAPSSEDNVPFTPRRFLKVNPDGLAEGDFVFLLGYPGRTYRHQCAAFVDHEETVRMPYIADYFEDRINRLEAASSDDAKLALELAPTIKSLANTMKNFRGKLLGLNRLSLVAKKRAEETELAEYIAADSERAATYGHVLPELNEIYGGFAEQQLLEFALWRVRSQNRDLWGFIEYLAAGQGELDKESGDRRAAFNDEAVAERLAATDDFLKSMPESVIREDLVSAIAALVDSAKATGLSDIVAWAEALAPEASSREVALKAVTDSGIMEAELRAELLPADSGADQNVLIELAGLLRGHLPAISQDMNNRRGRLDALMSLYVDVKQSFKSTDFVPDANSTLRLTYGHIRSYRPRDGILYHPFTTLKGMMEKATGSEPFDPPAKLVDLFEKRDYGRWASKELGDVPVGILYDCDTTGGNSGSPVMNKRGELVGVNFDRAYEATINDFQWSQDYSRSIGVDIRYVLFITEKLMAATRVIDELLN